MSHLIERSPIADAPLSLVLLARNNAAIIEEVIAGWGLILDELGRPYEILLVDNGSQDGTADRAAALAARYPTLTILRHGGPGGVGAALRRALAAAQHPLLATATADQQFQPADLNRLLEVINHVDLVTGFRVGPRVPWWLRGIHTLYRWLVKFSFGIPLEPLPAWLGWQAQRHLSLGKWLFGVRMHDPECAFRLYRRAMFQRLPLQSDGPFAQLEILAKANFLGCLMAEVPVSWTHSPSIPDKWDRREVMALFRHPTFGLPSPPETPAMPPDEQGEPCGSQPTPGNAPPDVVA